MMTPTETRPLDIPYCRRQFPALARQIGGEPVVYFDGPAGSQVPRRVAEAVADYLLHTNANHAGRFATSRESDALLDEAGRALADFLGADDPNSIVFGPNMTSLTFAVSRAIGRTLRPGDEIIVTNLDHDANFTPWVLAAEDAGAVVRGVGIRSDDCTLDLDDLAAQLSPRTRLVAVTCASNAVGSLTPVAEIVGMAHEAGALVYLDAVHYAPHRLPDVAAWGADLVVCSAYKFFGPHVGVLWGRGELLQSLPAYKVRPAPEDPPGRWMTGTANHEGIVGATAAVEYLADLGRRHEPHAPDRRRALQAAYRAIATHEAQLIDALLAGLTAIPEVRLWGIADRDRLSERVPTVSIRHERLPPQALADYLAERGIFAWHGNFYALPLTETLGLEPEGLLRIGLLHYNTYEEVVRLIESLEALS
jgi:cysteine desulfurase family protein (TIGR01976 family)